MPRKKTLTLTNAEHRIMEVIWAKGSATVAEVVEALNGKDAYTTILTLMTILKGKGYLSSRKEGRAFVFVPRVDRDTAARKAVHPTYSRNRGPGGLRSTRTDRGDHSSSLLPRVGLFDSVTSETCQSSYGDEQQERS